MDRNGNVLRLCNIVLSRAIRSCISRSHHENIFIEVSLLDEGERLLHMLGVWSDVKWLLRVIGAPNGVSG